MDVEVEHPHIHHGAGHHWVDRLATFAALFVSAVSIFIAWHHGETMKELVHQNERLVAASSLPHVLLFGSNGTSDGRSEITFAAVNQGVGPAEIRSVEVLFDGKTIDRPTALLAACCNGAPAPGLITTTLYGTMIRPGETVAYLRLPVTPANEAAAKALDAARQSNRLETRICYCSVFDECWTRSSRDFDRPHPVKSCPMPKTPYRY